MPNRIIKTVFSDVVVCSRKVSIDIKMLYHIYDNFELLRWGLGIQAMVCFIFILFLPEKNILGCEKKMLNNGN